MEPKNNSESKLTNEEIEQIQIIEQNLDQLLMQKNSFRFELDETNYALTELNKSGEEVFKIVAGQIIIKSDKETLRKELDHKKKLIELRLSAIEKETEEFKKSLDNLKDKITTRLSLKESK